MNQNTNTNPELKIAKFGDSEIPVPATLTVDEIKQMLSPVFPRIASATAIEENGVVRFFVEAGEKGSEDSTDEVSTPVVNAAPELKIAKFGDSEIPVPASLTVDEIKQMLSPVFPRIASATAIEENGIVRFFVEAGEKGSEDDSDVVETPATETAAPAADLKIAKFGDSEIPVPASLTVDEIKQMLSPVFPRIASATAIEENGIVRFFVEAGEKGSDEPADDTSDVVDAPATPELKIAKFGDSEIPVPASLTVDEIKQMLSPVFPRIASATAIEENGIVRFFVEAGEKGSDDDSSEVVPTPDTAPAAPELKIAKFGDSEIPVPASLTVDEIKQMLSPVFPRIASATAIEENGIVRFFVEAGEKGLL